MHDWNVYQQLWLVVIYKTIHHGRGLSASPFTPPPVVIVSPSEESYQDKPWHDGWCIPAYILHEILSLPFFMTGIEWESEPKWCNFATKPCMGSVTRFMDVYLKYLQFLLPILGFLFRGFTTVTGINQNFRFQSV